MPWRRRVRPIHKPSMVLTLAILGVSLGAFGTVAVIQGSPVVSVLRLALLAGAVIGPFVYLFVHKLKLVKGSHAQ